jgi:hypothetical protein
MSQHLARAGLVARPSRWSWCDLARTQHLVGLIEQLESDAEPEPEPPD